MPEKDPTTWTAATWLLALGMAFGGGVICSEMVSDDLKANGWAVFGRLMRCTSLLAGSHKFNANHD